MSISNLEKIAQAVEMAAHRTPGEVVEAFAPTTSVVLGVRLQPFRLGAYICLERLAHPLVQKWVDGRISFTMHDLVTALYVLSRPSAEVLREIEAGTLGDRVMELADQVEVGPLLTEEAQAEAMQALWAHIDRQLSLAVPMEAPGKGQKKTADLVGG